MSKAWGTAAIMGCEMNRDPRSDEEILRWFQSEYEHHFEGWDYISGSRRVMIGFDFWDYPTIAAKAVRASKTVLEQGTGGGERFGEILEAADFDGKAYATEGFAPSVEKARERLAPFGVEVIEVSLTAEIPIEDGSLDLILNRHSGWHFEGHLRKLRPGGAVVTQQVGHRTNREIHRVLGVPFPDPDALSGMAGAREAAEGAGFSLIVAAESFPVTSYTDVGALVYLLKAVSWQIPDFTVDRYAEQLLKLHHTLVNEKRNLDVGFHQMLMVMQKPGGEGLIVPHVSG